MVLKCYSKPERSKPRTYSPRDLQRIFGYVCREHGRSEANKALKKEKECWMPDEECQKLLVKARVLLAVAAAALVVIEWLQSLLLRKIIGRLLKRLPGVALLLEKLKVFDTLSSGVGAGKMLIETRMLQTRIDDLMRLRVPL